MVCYKFTISLTASNDLPIGCNKVHTSCTFTNKLLLDFLILDTNQHIKDVMIWVWLENRINVPKSQFVPTMILSHGSNEYNFFYLIVVHTSVFCNKQYWLVRRGLANRGFCLCNWHCPSQQCSTSVSHPGVHLFCSLHQKAWVHWAHQSGWVMHRGAIQHNLARSSCCTDWSWRCKVYM